MHDEFEILAAKSLAGEASAEERARLLELLARDAELAEEFEKLKATWAAISDLGQAAQAIDAPPAPIPAARLHQLQQVVRKEFGAVSSSMDKLEDASPSSTPTGSTSTRTNAARRREAEPALLTVVQWWQSLARQIGLKPIGLASLTVGLVVLIASGIFLSRHPHRPPPSSRSSEIAAYLFTLQGSPEVRRAKETLRATPVMALRFEDEITLPAGTAAQVILPSGSLELRGPEHLLAAALPTKVRTQTSTLGSDNSQAPTNTNARVLQTALFTPAEQLPHTGLLVATRGGQRIPLYSPVGSTADMTPLILWKTESGKTYDLVISDVFNPNTVPLRLSSVKSPIQFTQVEAWKGRNLSRNGLYKITLREEGKPLTASEYTFRTLEGTEPAKPASPAEHLLHAYGLLIAQPDRLGDVMADLSTLPPEFADSELALRLKLFAFGQLGYAEDYGATATKIRALSSAH